MMQVPHVQAQTFKQNLECPISLNRINTAMTLDPCGHSVNTDIAQGLFGAIIGGMAVNPGPCPVCATHVVKYIPNIALRNTAQDVDALLPDILPPVLPAIPMAPLVATRTKPSAKVIAALTMSSIASIMAFVTTPTVIGFIETMPEDTRSFTQKFYQRGPIPIITQVDNYSDKLSKAMFTAVVTGLSTAVGINFYEYLKK